MWLLQSRSGIRFSFHSRFVTEKALSWVDHDAAPVGLWQHSRDRGFRLTDCGARCIQRCSVLRALGRFFPPAILIIVTPGFASETMAREVFLPSPFLPPLLFSLPLPSIDRSIGTCSRAATPALFPTVVEEHRPDLREALRDVRVQVASSSSAFPNLCSYSLVSHSQCSTVSFVCAIA